MLIKRTDEWKENFFGVALNIAFDYCEDIAVMSSSYVIVLTTSRL